MTNDKIIFDKNQSILTSLFLEQHILPQTIVLPSSKTLSSTNAINFYQSFGITVLDNFLYQNFFEVQLKPNFNLIKNNDSITPNTYFLEKDHHQRALIYFNPLSDKIIPSFLPLTRFSVQRIVDTPYPPNFSPDDTSFLDYPTCFAIFDQVNQTFFLPFSEFTIFQNDQELIAQKNLVTQFLKNCFPQHMHYHAYWHSKIGFYGILKRNL